LHSPLNARLVPGVLSFPANRRRKNASACGVYEWE